MFLKSQLLFLYVETPLHAGAGSGVGAIDLPIQRERVTHYPIVQASGIKGALRSEVINAQAKKQETTLVFGAETNASELHAGAFSPGDARLLLFPVRSLKGVFAWTTSVDVLRRWVRELHAAGFTNVPDLPDDLPATSDDTAFCYASGSGAVLEDKSVVLEEYTYSVRQEATGKSAALAQWLADNALPKSEAYAWWRQALREKLIILPDDDFRDFTQYATEILTRIRLNPDTKTVEPGALWTEEHLPTDTLLYVPVRATRFRAENGHLPPAWREVKEAKQQAETVLSWIRDAQNVPHRLQLGGDETVGRGMVALHWLDASEVQ